MGPSAVVPRSVSAAVRNAAGVCDEFRGATVAKTLAAGLRMMEEAGVTRLADLTGLDRIGVPIVSAIRPNARSVTSASGKGLDFAAACLSAVMEALEQHHAESALPDCTLAELPAGVLVPVFAALPRARGARPLDAMDTSQLALSKATDIVGNAPAAVPFDLVHCVLEPSWPSRGSGFLVSTNGLAGGSSRGEAILHGICEVIERDALALLHARDPQHAMAAERRVDLERTSDDACAALDARCRAAGLELSAFEITSEIGVPVYYARVGEPRAARLGALDGSGCHPVPEIALRRALLEAIQTRALMISGVRDEIRSHEYRAAALLTPEGSSVEVAGGRDHRVAGTEDALRFVVSRLVDNGFGEVLVVDLPCEHEGLAFVRVVIPGLEGPIHSPVYVPGARAHAAVP